MSYNYKVKFTADKGLSTLLPVITSVLESTNLFNKDELDDFRCAIYEAINNVEIHAYPNSETKPITVELKFKDNKICAVITDKGVGIENIEKASEPMFTSFPDECAGLGISIMKSYSENTTIKSTVGKGTKVTIVKTLGGKSDEL